MRENLYVPYVHRTQSQVMLNIGGYMLQAKKTTVPSTIKHQQPHRIYDITFSLVSLNWIETFTACWIMRFNEYDEILHKVGVTFRPINYLGASFVPSPFSNNFSCARLLSPSEGIRSIHRAYNYVGYWITHGGLFIDITTPTQMAAQRVRAMVISVWATLHKGV